jgi:hypothetical protein
MLREVRLLNQLRLEHNLTYQAVADAMKAIGYPLAARTIHQLIKNPNVTPNERTLFKIRKYLAYVKDGEERAARGVADRAMLA